MSKSASDRAEALSDEMLEIDLSTVDGNTVRGRITEVKPVGSKIKVEAEAPGGDTVSERMDKPVPWSTKYQFARLVESKGHGIGTSHHIVGERVLLKRNGDDEWEIEDPKGIEYYWKHYKWSILGLVSGIAIGIGLLSLVPSLSSLSSSETSTEGTVAMTEVMMTAAEIIPLMTPLIMLIAFLFAAAGVNDDA